MPKFLQKSFSKGILSPNAFSRENLPGYSEALRDAHNFLIGRTGELYRRGGTALLEKRDNPIERVIPFNTQNDTYLLIFERASNKIDIDDLDSSDDSFADRTEDYPFIRVLKMTDHIQQVRNFADIDVGTYQNSTPVKIYKKGHIGLSPFESYARDPEEPFAEGELANMTYCQIGNAMVFANESGPPFWIRKAGDNFVYFRSVLDLLLNGNQSNSVIDALSGLPYSYYGMGLIPQYIDRNDQGGQSSYFRGYLRLNQNYDKEGVAEHNFSFWENRAFICSVSKQDTDNVIVYGGIFNRIYKRGGGARRFKVEGRLFYRGSEDLEEIDDRLSLSNLYLCDWSPFAGWPRSVAEYENRFVYGGSEAYPAKIWFSSQPSVQRVPFGNQVTITDREESLSGTTGPVQGGRAEIRTEKPIYKTVYYDQLDMFNKDESALGLVLQNPASAASHFVNDAEGLDIYWIAQGEVLFIGTNKGVFISRGTDASAPTPVPFNTGFQQVDYVPVKRVFPVVVGKTLYYVTRDNSVRKLMFGSQSGYKAENLDSFSREVVRDTSELKTIARVLSVPTFDNDRSKFPTEDVEDALGELAGRHIQDLSLSNFSEKVNSTSTEIDMNLIKIFPVQPEDKVRASPYNDITQTVYQNNTLYSSARYILGQVKNSIPLAPEFIHNIDFMRDIFSRARELENSRLKDFGPYTIILGFKVSLRYNLGTVSIDSEDVWVVKRAVHEIELLYGESEFDHLGVVSKRNDIKTLGSLRKPLDYNDSLEWLVDSIPFKNTEDVNPQYITVESRYSSAEKGGVVAKGNGLTSSNSGLAIVVGEDPFEDMVQVRRCTLGNTGNRKLTVWFDKQAEQFPEDVKKIMIGIEKARRYVPLAEWDKATLVLENNLYKFEANTTEVIADNTIGANLEFKVLGDNDKELCKFYLFVGVPAGGVREYKIYDTLPFAGNYDVKKVSLFYEDNTYLDEFPRQWSSKPTISQTKTYVRNIAKRLENILSLNAYNFDLILRDVDFVVQIFLGISAQRNKNYRPFSPDTRMFYDWLKKALFIMRKEGYLAYTRDEQAGVAGWQRGDMGFSDATYLGNLGFQLPEKHPAIVGVKDSRVLLNVAGLHGVNQRYVNDLPNCLDDHILFSLPDKDFNLLNLKNKLLTLGFKAEDIISVASPAGIVGPDNLPLLEKKLNDLDGSFEYFPKAGGSRDFIVGRSYLSSLLSWPVAIPIKGDGSLKGRKFALVDLLLYTLLHSDFNLNGRPTQIKNRIVRKDSYRDTIKVYEYLLSKGMAFDPVFELAIKSPFPLAFTGWTMNVKVGA